MDYDVSISIGTQADLGGLHKAQQAVDGLAKAAGKVPGSLLSGGVGGASAPPVYTGTAFSNGGMSWQLDGASELTGSIKQVDKTIGNATQGMEKNSGWLARSINLMSSLPDKIKGWAGQQMQDWRKFDGGLQNLKNVGQLGREWWDYGWKAGQMLSNAFGVGVNKIQSHVATALDAAKAKMAAWQTSLSDTLSRQKEEKWLKKEEAGVKQINAAYETRKKVIEDLDRKAQARLELENKLLQIETEKNRSIIRQRQIRGDISDSQARDELAKLDAKDAEDRRRIEQQQAEQALKTAQQLAEAKEEQVRRLQEFQRMPNKGNVENLSKEGLFGQVDNLKAADAALKDWQRIAQRKAELEKEISKADGKMAKTAMVPAASPFLIAALRQKKAQDEESLKSVLAEQQAMAGQYGMQGQDFGQVAAMLAKRSQDARTALDKSMALIKGTGLLGDLSGKSGDAVYLEYARVLSVVKDLANNQGEYIEAALKESVAAQDAVDQAGARLRDLLALHGAQRAAETQVSAETGKTNAQQDDKQHAATLASSMADRLVKAAEAQHKAAERQTRAAENTKTQLGYAVDSLNRYAEKYEDTPLSGGIERILQTITKLQGKPVKDRTKEETKDLEQLRKWIENVKDDGRFDNLVKAATAALDNMDAALAAEKKRKEAEAKAKTLEERSRKLADLDGQMDRKSKDALTLDDWMIKERGRLTGRMGELGRTDVSGRLPEVEALVRKVLSDQGDGGKGISRRESGELTRMLQQLEAISPRDSTPELEAAMSLIREMLTSYRTTSANQARTLAELNKLRQEVARIKSQTQFGPRK
ncbi:hypothetical protein NKE62_01105 [Akkermansia sp. Marseille-P9185]|uniref:hypothetical protein n=1 Tax=Akkermansia massiliensis TaxID=2927224 RepID=UPI00202FC572|nr:MULTISPECIES: hypothetical protein [Akkermansia]MCM0684744.1 hypothetical protein [Akkermansia sp. B2-R-115]MCO8185516.1 hypothetical protein [Akkermansia massiliensis]